MADYIYIEGEKTKEGKGSEYLFWTKVKALFMKESVLIVPCNGISDLYTKLKQKTFNKEDNIIVSFDNCGNMYARKLKKELLPKISGRVNKLYFTSYFCFEEIFLSYINMEQYLDMHYVSKNYANLYKCFSVIRNCINSGINYLAYPDESIKAEMDNNKNISNREQLASNVLGRITGTAGRRLHIGKSSLGSCWVTDCKSLIDKYGKYACGGCTCSLNKAVDKLNDLQAYSIWGKELKIQDLSEFAK